MSSSYPCLGKWHRNKVPLSSKDRLYKKSSITILVVLLLDLRVPLSDAFPAHFCQAPQNNPMFQAHFSLRHLLIFPAICLEEWKLSFHLSPHLDVKGWAGKSRSLFFYPSTLWMVHLITGWTSPIVKFHSLKRWNEMSWLSISALFKIN